VSWSPATGTVPPLPPARRQGVLVYLAVLATVYVVVSLVLGVLNYTAAQSSARTMHDDSRKIEQLQTDTNDNLCNQQAYQGGTNCIGGDTNGGSSLNIMP
jgi:hypothetical protein